MSEPVEKALGFLCTPSAEHMSDGQRIDEFCHIGRKAVGEITIMRAMLAANETEIARLREALKPLAEAVRVAKEAASYNRHKREHCISQSMWSALCDQEKQARAAMGETE